MKKNLSKVLAIVLSIVLCASILPISILASDASNTITAYVTIANKGKIAVGNDSNKTMMAQVPVTVTDTNDDGIVSIDEALTQTHQLYCQDGYVAADGSWGPYITKLWNVENDAEYGYYVNHSMAMSLNDSLNDGDYLNAYIGVNAYPNSDSYSFFNVYSATITPNTSLDLVLNKIGFDDSWNTVSIPVENAKICLVNAATGELEATDIVTSVAGTYTAAGAFSLSFTKEGTYYVSAQKDDIVLVPAICKITVKNGADTVINYVGDSSFELNESSPKDSIDVIYKNVGNYIYGLIEDNPVEGIENFIMPLARAGVDFSSSYVDSYIQNVADTVEEGNGTPSLIFALTALGKDASNIDGKNYLQKFKSLDDLKGSYITNEAYALIAINTANYWQEIKDLNGTANADDIVADLVSKQVTNGGWGYDGVNIDIDTTGMIIQALAPYYSSNSDVKVAVDKALIILSNTQQNNGAYLNWGTENSSTAAEVAIALCCLGINPATDSRFVKPQGSLMDAILRSYIDGKGFSIEPEGTVENEYATYECYMALVAYERLVNGQNTIFDMSDVDFVQFVSNSKTGDVDNNSQIPVVQISAGRNVIADGSILSVTPSTLNKDNINVGNNKSVIMVIDISLQKNGEEVQPNGKIKVKISIPSELKDEKDLGVFWIKNDGTAVDMNAVVEDGYLVFESDHLSNYAIVSSKQAELIANTADTNNVIAVTTAALSAVIGATYVISLKKKET